jgi:hypothetical protein
MGGAFTGSGMKNCDGSDVLAELDAVFGDPGDTLHPNDRYSYAQQNNIFGSVKEAAIPYRALIAAYSEAGVEVCARWGAYLRKNLTAQNILDIADIRDNALRAGVPIKTKTHAHGGPVQTHKGKSKTDPSTIDSPF